MINKIMNLLDEFVKSRGSGTYVLPPPLTTDDTGIQQDRNEIMCFSLILLDLFPRNNILEIGFGPYGGTHYLWTLLFEKVCTIEWDRHKLSNKTFPTNENSIFIIDDALKSSTLDQVREKMSVLDVLFLDGNHTYKGISKEREMYSPLVREKGIIAYHDSNQDYEVKGYLKDLESGVVDGRKHEIKYLHLSHVGLTYEVV